MLEIPGVYYHQEFLTTEEHDYYLAKIDGSTWLNDLARRVQHYGYKYSYKTRRIDETMFLGPLPEWAQELALRLYNYEIMPVLADQVIVNEYLPGQGIANHIDCISCFGSTIVTISLCSGCIMDFTAPEPSTSRKWLYLQPKSVLRLSNEARYQWKHGIAKRKTDRLNGIKIPRERRVSITFRSIVLNTSN